MSKTNNIRFMDGILNKHIRTLLTLTLVSVLAGAAQASDLTRQIRFELQNQVQIWDPIKPVEPTPVFEAGIVLVQFAEGTDQAAAERLVAKGGYEATTMALFNSLRVLPVRVPEGSEEAAINFFRSSRAVQHAERSPIVGIMG